MSVQEVMKELPKEIVEHHTIVKQKPEYKTVEKHVEVPEFQVSEQVQEVVARITHEKVIEVPQTQVIETLRQVPCLEYQEVLKEVHLPVIEGREQIQEAMNRIY